MFKASVASVNADVITTNNHHDIEHPHSRNEHAHHREQAVPNTGGTLIAEHPAAGHYKNTPSHGEQRCKLAAVTLCPLRAKLTAITIGISVRSEHPRKHGPMVQHAAPDNRTRAILR